MSEVILSMEHTIDRISTKPLKTKNYLKRIIEIDLFPSITFDEAVKKLVGHGYEKLISFTNHGRDISSQGEIKLMEILDIKTPVWIKYFDRDRVPFYQKPYSKNKEKAINADLLFPKLSKDAFGGEVIGCGQRQNNVVEMYESLARQGISHYDYEWYINLRKFPNYSTTSGFGLGIERFISAILGKKDIKDVILYPRLKNIKTYP